MTPAGAVRLVAERELTLRLRSGWFLLGTLAIIAVMAGYVLLQMSAGGGEGRSDVGFAGQASVLGDRVTAEADELGLDVDATTVVDMAAAHDDLAAGSLDAVVSGTAAELRVQVAGELNPRLRAVLTELSRQEVLAAHLARAGVPDPEAVMAEANATRIDVAAIDADDTGSDQRIAIGVVMALLLFLSITTHATFVARGVVEEKSSRVVEVLLTALRPWQLLLGKVIGIGLAGLIQLAAIAAAGIGLAAAAGLLTPSGVAVSTLVWGAVWYLLGFVLYAALFASAGALVSRQEDAQAVLTPVTAMLVVGVVAGFTLMIVAPDGTAVSVLSLLPPLSPVLLPARIAAGDVVSWQVALAVGLTLATTVLVSWLGGRIYRNAVPHTDSRVTLTTALRGR